MEISPAAYVLIGSAAFVALFAYLTYNPIDTTTTVARSSLPLTDGVPTQKTWSAGLKPGERHVYQHSDHTLKSKTGPRSHHLPLGPS